ncbi:MAG: hypothetical protein IJ911_13840 [Salinivirgaceae bacterium]|nr:hypothetical protein [Salinivirgaceae bacterium]
MTRNRNTHGLALSIGLIAVSALTLVVSCQFWAKNTTVDMILAKTGSAELTLQQVSKLMPSNLKGADSVQFVQNYVDKWIHNRLMLELAITNIDAEGYESIENMVNDYRTALLVYKYQQLYIEQNLDTLVLDSQIADHYDKYGNNFLLDSSAVKVVFVQIPNTLANANKIRSLVRNNRPDDLPKLEEYCEKDAREFDMGANWRYLSDAVRQMPRGSIADPKAIAKSGRFVEARDSLYNYYFMVKEFRDVNEQAPLVFAKEKIREILLNHRKNDLIRNLEIKIYVDAVNKQRFTNYVN